MSNDLKQRLLDLAHFKHDDLSIAVDAKYRIEELEQQLTESKEEYGRACHLVAQMHFAATGEVTGPKLGVAEDVAEVRQQLEDARRTAEYWKAEHLAGNKQLTERENQVTLLRQRLSEIAWSNDSKWQSDCAMEALATTKEN